MSVKMLCLFTGVVLCGGALSGALARENGVNCNPIRADLARIEYSQFGVHNLSTVLPATIHCSGAKLTSFDSSGVAIDVYDRHTTEDVCCTALLQKPNGATLSSGRRCSAGFGSAVQTLSIPLAPTTGFVNLVCTIPPATGNGFSHVTNYHVFPAE